MARFVLGGHRDRFVLGRHRDKNIQHGAHSFHNDPLLAPNRTRSGIGAPTGALENVTKDYLQSAVTMQRDKFVKPKELRLGHNNFLKIVMPLDGQSEFGDYGAKTLSDHSKTHSSTGETRQTPLFSQRIGGDSWAVSEAMWMIY